MKILFITDTWKPQLNGVVKTYENLSSELESQDHEVQIIHPEDFTRRASLCSYPEIKLALFPYKHLKALIDGKKPDHIHIATEGPLGWAGRKYCIRKNIGFTTSYHTNLPDYVSCRVARFLPFLRKSASMITQSIVRKFHEPSACVLISTQSLRDKLKDFGFQNHFHLMTRGVDLDIFHPGEKTLFHDRPGPIALYVGRVSIEKNIEDFLAMPWDGSKIIVGDGPALKGLSEKYPNVHFTGRKTGQDLAEHYRAADLFVFPSRTDTFGIVILEALACGLPVAAYHVDGPRDILTQPGLGALEPTDLSRAAQRALHCGSAVERFNFIKDHYTWKNAAEQFMEAVRTCAKATPGDHMHNTPSNRRTLAGGTLLFLALSFLLNAVTFFPLLPYLAMAATGLYIGLVGHILPLGSTKETTPKTATEGGAASSVSIVIPAHNEERVIRETLLDMAKIEYPNTDILVMDDRSTDSTARILEATVAELRAQGHTHIRYHTRAPNSTPGKSAVLNDALKMTTGDILAVFDADARIKPNIFSMLTPHFENSDISAFQLRKTISNAQDNILTLAQELEYGFDSMLQTSRGDLNAATELRGNGQFIRRQAALDIGGWNEKTITDDLDLSTRLHAAGHRIGFIPDHRVYEQGVRSLKDLYKQRMRWAEGSLRRYLDFTRILLQSRKTSWPTKADALFYTFNTFIPVAIFLEGLALLAALPFAPEAKTGLAWLLLTLPLLWALSMPGLNKSIREDFDKTALQALPKTLLAATYMLFLWFPVIINAYLRILIWPSAPFRWHKAARIPVEKPENQT